MKAKQLILTVLLCLAFVFNVNGQWTWIKGSNIPNATPVFGTIGVEDVNNNPDGVYEGVNFFDPTTGNFWFYGGGGVWGDRNMLWKYNTSTNNWTAIKGTISVSVYPIWGTKGVPSPTNNPGSRALGAASWVDNNGKFWLFGGYGYTAAGNGNFDDLWKYDPLTNEWTWISGDKIINKIGVYGTQGIPTATTNPSARYECSATWVDANNNLWLFGGINPFGATFVADHNDLWKYNISTNQWTWMKGSNTINSPAVYGTLNVESSTTTPPAQCAYSSFKNNNELWLWGGESTNSLLNTMWSFNPTTNNWTWRGGNNSMNYSSHCSVGMIPPKMETRARATDNNGLWVFGSDCANSSWGNDLWFYCFNTKQWIWVSGDASNPSAVWGTQGVANFANKPVPTKGGLMWIVNGNIYVYGGYDPTSNRYNVVWKYTNVCNNTICNNVLPVELTYFTAKCENNFVILEWQTASEINNDYFTIEKSEDGEIYSEFKNVKGIGNSDKNINYSVKDDINTHKVFYKLKQTDFNGEYKYFNIVVLECDELTPISVININGVINIKNPYKTNNILSVEVYNYLGSLIFHRENLINKEFEIDLSNMASSIYILQVKTINNVITNKIILTK